MRGARIFLALALLSALTAACGPPCSPHDPECDGILDVPDKADAGADGSR
jgi:hypothetical protein